MKPEEQRVLGILATILEPSLLGSGFHLLTIYHFHRHRPHLSWDYRRLSSTSKTKNHGHYRNISRSCLCRTAAATQVLYANVYKEFVREFQRSIEGKFLNGRRRSLT